MKKRIALAVLLVIAIFGIGCLVFDRKVPEKKSGAGYTERKVTLNDVAKIIDETIVKMGLTEGHKPIKYRAFVSDEPSNPPEPEQNFILYREKVEINVGYRETEGFKWDKEQKLFFAQMTVFILQEYTEGRFIFNESVIKLISNVKNAIKEAEKAGADVAILKLKLLVLSKKARLIYAERTVANLRNYVDFKPSIHESAPKSISDAVQAIAEAEKDGSKVAVLKSQMPDLIEKAKVRAEIDSKRKSNGSLDTGIKNTYIIHIKPTD